MVLRYCFYDDLLLISISNRSYVTFLNKISSKFNLKNVTSQQKEVVGSFFLILLKLL